jgi:hypothetical protein
MVFPRRGRSRNTTGDFGMAVEVIEGTLEASEPSKSKRGYARYDRLSFAVPDAQPRTFAKVAAGPAMIEEIRRGGAGRYYMATVDGAKALIGVRRADGGATYAHYHNFEPIILVVGLLGTSAAVARFGLGIADMPLLASVLGPLLLIGWFYFRSQRLAQRKVFEADGS